MVSAQRQRHCIWFGGLCGQSEFIFIQRFQFRIGILTYLSPSLLRRYGKFPMVDCPAQWPNQSWIYCIISVVLVWCCGIQRRWMSCWLPALTTKQLSGMWVPAMRWSKSIVIRIKFTVHAGIGMDRSWWPRARTRRSVWSIRGRVKLKAKLTVTKAQKQLKLFSYGTALYSQPGECFRQRVISARDSILSLFSFRFNRSSERQYSLRAPDALNDPIVMVELDTSNGVMFPLYDPDTNLVFLCGKGDSVIRYFEVWIGTQIDAHIQSVSMNHSFCFHFAGYTGSAVRAFH